jgi:hypothetical protein
MQGYHILHNLDGLEPVVATWVQVVRDMVAEWDRKGYEDVPWVHREIPNSAKERLCISLFAGAIWKQGGMCLEEYPDWKTKNASRYHGRADLYGMVHGIELTAEAKSVWINPETPNGSLDELSDKLKEALKDVRKSPQYPENRLLGMVFGVPCIPKKGTTRTSITERLKWLIQEFPKIEADAYAYVFPVSQREFCNEESIYPGVALLIKEERSHCPSKTLDRCKQPPR